MYRTYPTKLCYFVCILVSLGVLFNHGGKLVTGYLTPSQPETDVRSAGAFSSITSTNNRCFMKAGTNSLWCKTRISKLTLLEMHNNLPKTHRFQVCMWLYCLATNTWVPVRSEYERCSYWVVINYLHTRAMSVSMFGDIRHCIYTDVVK